MTLLQTKAYLRMLQMARAVQWEQAKVLSAQVAQTIQDLTDWDVNHPAPPATPITLPAPTVTMKDVK